VNPNEDDTTLHVYPEQSVKNGLIAVSPQIITALGQKAAERGIEEGDISLRLHYEDFLGLATMAGYNVVEIKRGVDL
jgi:hypothetical protein